MKLITLLLRQRWAPLLLPVAALLLWQRDCSMKAQGALQAEVDSLETSRARILAHQQAVDSILTVDTLFRADTVRQIVAEERRACDAVVSTCEAEKANLRSQIGNMRTQLGLERKKRPGIFSQLEQKAIWLGIGFGAAKILAR